MRLNIILKKKWIYNFSNYSNWLNPSSNFFRYFWTKKINIFGKITDKSSFNRFNYNNQENICENNYYWINYYRSTTKQKKNILRL